jgi:serine/threonine protein phosphatase PrpC
MRNLAFLLNWVNLTMRYLSFLEPPTAEAIKAFADKMGLTKYLSESYEHPQEDYLLTPGSPPVFVVADGVTLNFKKIAEAGELYPAPSPAGEVAKIFCEAVVESAREKYDQWGTEQIIEIFQAANKEVEKYNRRVGPSDISGNPTGFYSATGAFVIIKDAKAYWASLCDSYVVHFDQEMRVKFKSTGSCRPYAVINGEARMTEQVAKGVLDLNVGDRIFVFTDGFEAYVKNEEFLALFKNGADDLEQRIKEFSQRMNHEDPENYGHERSLIAVFI